MRSALIIILNIVDKVSTSYFVCGRLNHIKLFKPSQICYIVHTCQNLPPRKIITVPQSNWHYGLAERKACNLISFFRFMLGCWWWFDSKHHHGHPSYISMICSRICTAWKKNNYQIKWWCGQETRLCLWALCLAYSEDLFSKNRCATGHQLQGKRGWQK